MTTPRQPFGEFQLPYRQTVTHYGPFTDAGAEATGTILCAANTAAADGDTVTIGDGINPVVTYEYDKSANGVTSGNVSWAAGTTAASNATALRLLILANQPDLSVVDDLAGTLTLTHKISGAFANVTITHSGAVTTTVTGMSGGTDPSVGTSATSTLALETLDAATRIDSVEILNPTGFAAHASNYWTLTLQKGSTVIATWSTLTGQEGTITANTKAAMRMSSTDANTVGAAGDLLKLVLTKTGTPAAFPAGRVVAHGRIVA
jgi:hypothetical protein